MSLTKEAIELLKQAETQDLILKAISKTESDETMLPLPESYAVRDIEQFFPERRNLRANFYTNNIVDFCDYISVYNECGICTIDAKKMSAKAILDFGNRDNPLHQQHQANIILDKTAAFSALISLSSRRADQAELSDFIEDWADTVVVLDPDGQQIKPSIASHRIRGVTIDKIRDQTSDVQNFSNSLSESEKIELRNKETMPSVIRFKCTPYGNLTERTFDVKLSVITGGQRPEFSARIVRLEQHNEEMAKEFKELIIQGIEQADLDTEFSVFIGSV